MRDAGVGKRVRNLRAHAANNLVIFDGHNATLRLFDGSADCGDIDVIDEWIIDDRRLLSFFGELLAGFNRSEEKWTGGDQHNVRTLREDLRFAPFVFGAFDPA